MQLNCIPEQIFTGKQPLWKHEKMAFEESREAANSLLQSQPWAQELAGILPLSTLIDFVDIPQHFHAFELTGSAPLWSWPITPANSRILLSKSYTEKSCY